ncbi:hypothetical protein Tco_0780837, partial [Tanacetum coccineum]
IGDVEGVFMAAAYKEQQWGDVACLVAKRRSRGACKELGDIRVRCWRFLDGCLV